MSDSRHHPVPLGVKQNEVRAKTVPIIVVNVTQMGQFVSKNKIVLSIPFYGTLSKSCCVLIKTAEMETTCVTIFLLSGRP